MIPARYSHVVYTDVPKDIRNSFEQMFDTRKGLYIHGGVGTGKTHIAYALFGATKEKIGVNARFHNTTELLREIRQDYDRKGYDKTFAEERIREFRGLMFLDDIGSEKISDWVAETFYLIINEKYNEKIPMVFTSNLTIGELSERVGDRITSRIVEMCDVFELTGADRRLTK